MGGNTMSILNVEIIEYVNSSDLDEDIKKFLRWAIINEIKNPDSMRYKQNYENSADAHYGLGIIYEKKGDLVKARAEWRKTLKIDSNYEDAIKKVYR